MHSMADAAGAGNETEAAKPDRAVDGSGNPPSKKSPCENHRLGKAGTQYL